MAADPHFPMPARLGIEYMESIGKENIQVHAVALGCWLHEQIRSLRWSGTDKPFAFLPAVEEPSKQATSVSFLPLLEDGTFLPAAVLEKLAMTEGIAIRTGEECLHPSSCGFHRPAGILNH